MSIKDIIVYVDNDRDCENRLEAATSLCSTFEAKLNGLYLMHKLSVPAYAGAYVPVEVFDTNNIETTKLHDKAEALFNAKSKAGNIDSQFNAIEGDVNDILNQYSRYADLLIVPQRHKDLFDLNPYYQLSDVLLGAACAVLLLPDNQPVELPPERALLAWGGQRECARALKASMSMLTRVKKVDVLSINREAGEAKNIAAHLNRHGIETEVHSVEEHILDIGSLLLNQASALESQLIIMGAYGHSRIRELILGGATRHILEHVQLPVMFSH